MKVPKSADLSVKTALSSTRTSPALTSTILNLCILRGLASRRHGTGPASGDDVSSTAALVPPKPDAVLRQ